MKPRTLLLCLIALLAFAFTQMPLGPAALAQSGAVPLAAAPAESTRMGLWPLFRQSFDIFTIILLLGSVAGVSVIFVCIFEVREKNIAPEPLIARARDMARSGRWDDLSRLAADDDSFVARVLRRTLTHKGQDKAAIRDTAELAASEESARWFRRIDVLNVIGNLGPLVGLAGTVYGMIIAFTSLGETGGLAGAADLSLGISKALFHTLLGLCLAIPCLLAFGLYRAVVDRLCTRAVVALSEIVAMIPAKDDKPGI